jgi:hypothetical protein
MSVADLKEAEGRLVEMVRDQGSTWDLSPNDQAAIASVLAELRRLRAVEAAAIAWASAPVCYERTHYGTDPPCAECAAAYDLAQALPALDSAAEP